MLLPDGRRYGLKAAFVAGLLTHRQPTIYLAFGMQAGAAENPEAKEG